ncbi:hypothetical protein LTT95_00325 [Luteimonas sp. A1P009]|uniref:Phosphoribosyltransferase domain-containing protein n=1 Tax=Luteimonas fraxinea TaxID=2901869 RepID=A0ABS8U9E5_9GAMM|nr:hypothetical protein [Luteimonas fraxinea]MCD9126374.1 hypothetical protein [Luteimonas fraxinea]
MLRKTRHGDRDVEIAFPDLSSWRDRTPVLVDDIASSGRTLAVAARMLREQGLKTPECVVVHALFGDDAWETLVPLFARITSTDAVPHPSNRIALAPLIADALVWGLRTEPTTTGVPLTTAISTRFSGREHTMPIDTDVSARWRAGHGPIIHRADTGAHIDALVAQRASARPTMSSCGIERVLDIDTEDQLVASVLSKKIAAGTTHVLIDIPVVLTAKGPQPGGGRASGGPAVDHCRGVRPQGAVPADRRPPAGGTRLRPGAGGPRRARGAAHHARCAA